MTVVNKLDTINEKYRTFKMELLAGKNDFITTLNEGNCTIQLDFSKVYWNSKLQEEHQRLVDKYFVEKDLICDLCAGVGPFALNAAKNKKCIVFANDLNSECYKFLKINIEKNKLKPRVWPFCQDAKDFAGDALKLLNSEDGMKFVKTAFLEIHNLNNLKKNKSEPGLSGAKVLRNPLLFKHYIINLPGSSFEFLPYLKNAFSLFYNDNNLPIVHIYTFSKVFSFEKDLLIQAFTPLLSSFLDTNITDTDIIDIINVRKVSPNKYMYCISFRIPSTNKNLLREHGSKLYN